MVSVARAFSVLRLFSRTGRNIWSAFWFAPRYMVGWKREEEREWRTFYMFFERVRSVICLFG